MTIVNVAELPENYKNAASANLVKSDFDKLIANKGYDVYHDKVIACPCKGENVAALTSCVNCRGSGQIIIQRMDTIMVLQGMNFDTRYKDWSIERLGTVKITALEESEISYEDRITLKKGESIFNERIYPKVVDGISFSFLFYEPTHVNFCFLYKSDKEKPIQLEEGTDFCIEYNVFKLINPTYLAVQNPKISIRYRHMPQFTVIDIVRDIMYSDSGEQSGKRENVPFPIHGIGRRSHLLYNKENLSRTFYADNSIKAK